MDGNAYKKKPKVIPEGGQVKPVPGRKVWTKLRSGLFGWKQPQRVNISSNTSHEKSQYQKIFTPMRPKNCAAKSVEENSEISKIRKFGNFENSKIRKIENSVIVPPKIFFGGVGGSAVLTNNVSKKINNEGFRLSAENASSKQLPGGQNHMNATKEIGGEYLS